MSNKVLLENGPVLGLEVYKCKGILCGLTLNV
jgi:hypothetical protein